MRLTDAKVIVCSPGRNFVTLKITTEDGVYGLGDATLPGSGKSWWVLGWVLGGTMATGAVGVV